MFKKISAGFIIVVLSLSAGSRAVTAGMEFPQFYEMEEGNVVFHAKIEVPPQFKPELLKQSTADCVTADGEKAFKYFAGNRETVEYHEDSTTGEFYRTLADGSSFSYIPPGYISYTSENMQYYSAAYRYYDNRELFAQEKEFSFATQDDCMKKLRKLIQDIGYGNVQLTGSFYCLDYEALLAEEKHEDPESGQINKSRNKVSWTPEDNAYQFYASQQFQDLPVYHSILEIPDDDENGCLISGIYSSRGFENVSIMDIFEFHETNDKIELLPFEQCAEKVSEKYNRILTESVFTINRATLYQYIRRDRGTGKDQEVSPIWYFDVLEEGPDTENPEDKILRNRTVLINAVNGEEIVTE